MAKQRIKPLHENFNGYHIQIFGGNSLKERLEDITEKFASSERELSKFIDYRDSKGVTGINFNPFVEFAVVYHPFHSFPIKYFIMTASFEEEFSRNFAYYMIDQMGFQQSKIDALTKEALKSVILGIKREYKEVYNISVSSSIEPKKLIPPAYYFKFLATRQKLAPEEIKKKVKERYNDNKSLDLLFQALNYERTQN